MTPNTEHLCGSCQEYKHSVGDCGACLADLDRLRAEEPACNCATNDGTIPARYHAESCPIRLGDRAAEDIETEPCPTCMQPVPVPQRGDHDYGLPLGDRAAEEGR